MWSLLGMWAMGLHSHACLVGEGILPQKNSFANVLRAYCELRRHSEAMDGRTCGSSTLADFACQCHSATL
jgi:hypothetical protein